ncbi:cytochrome P450 [Abortiporus biennis]|nr:cytochrome P450 [Abortiporus biennis]
MLELCLHPFFSLSIIFSILVAQWRITRKKKVYPPGPKPLPVIGNLLDLPREKEILTFHDWAKEYGEVVHVGLFGHHVLLVNSFDAATELLNRRSANYSDRMHLHMICDLMGWDWAFHMMPYGERWKKHRRFFDSYFRSGKISKVWSVQTEKTHSLLQDLLEKPQEFLKHLKHASSSIIMKVTYGVDVAKSDDRFMSVADEAFDAMCKAATPGAFLVDVLPFLKHVPEWFPGAAFQKQAKQWKETTLEMRDAPYQAVVEAMAKGKASPCFVSDCMNGKNEEDAQIVRNCAALAFPAGSESTETTLRAFFLAMCLFPEVQAKAQAELDGVCLGRLPEFSDRQSLPYIDALCKELLRWSPVAPLAVPHMATNDDIYNGYFIPAGTIVLGNTWAITHDENVYPDAWRFMPERYFTEDGQPSDVPDPALAAFGYGRRICPGRFMADSELFIVVSSILSTLQIKPGPTFKMPSELDGFKPDDYFTCGMVNHVKNFDCTVKPRSERAAGIIRNAQLQH